MLLLGHTDDEKGWLPGHKWAKGGRKVAPGHAHSGSTSTPASMHPAWVTPKQYTHNGVRHGVYKNIIGVLSHESTRRHTFIPELSGCTIKRCSHNQLFLVVIVTSTTIGLFYTRGKKFP